MRIIETIKVFQDLPEIKKTHRIISDPISYSLVVVEGMAFNHYKRFILDETNIHEPGSVDIFFPKWRGMDENGDYFIIGKDREKLEEMYNKALRENKLKRILCLEL